MKNRKNKTGNVPGAHQKIVVTKDGPYVVSGRIPLTEQIITNDRDGFSCEWRKGEEIPAPGEIFSMPLRSVKNPAVLRWNAHRNRF